MSGCVCEREGTGESACGLWGGGACLASTLAYPQLGLQPSCLARDPLAGFEVCCSKWKFGEGSFEGTCFSCSLLLVEAKASPAASGPCRGPSSHSSAPASTKHEQAYDREEDLNTEPGEPTSLDKGGGSSQDSKGGGLPTSK